jgi:hypothetical protein
MSLANVRWQILDFLLQVVACLLRAAPVCRIPQLEFVDDFDPSPSICPQGPRNRPVSTASRRSGCGELRRSTSCRDQRTALPLAKRSRAICASIKMSGQHCSFEFSAAHSILNFALVREFQDHDWSYTSFFPFGQMAPRGAASMAHIHMFLHMHSPD